MIKSKLVVLMLTFTMVFSLVGCGNESSKKDDPNRTSIEERLKEVTLPDYEVIKIEDSSYNDVVNKIIHICVKSSDYTLDDLLNIAEKEALEYTKENEVNALTIGFYENESLIGNGYELGRVDYAPEGNFTKGADVKTGDYSTFEFGNYLEEKEVSLDNSLEEGETDIEQIKSDFSVYGDTVEASKNGSNLNINISVANTDEGVDNLTTPSDESIISSYVNICLMNLKNDIETIDIKVVYGEKTIEAVLKSSELNFENGRQFTSEYITSCIK